MRMILVPVVLGMSVIGAQMPYFSAHLEHQLLFGDSVFYHGAPSIARKALTELSHITYGFVPYWERTYNCPRWDLVSRIAYFNCTIGASGTITNSYYWYSAPVVDYAIAQGIPVDLCIAQFDNATINAIISSASARGACIRNSINAMLARGGSGINIDFEFPSSGYGDEFVTFCAEFRESLNARAPGAWLSVCLPSVDWSNVFFTNQLKNYCNAMFIMGYAYHYGGSSTTGPNDPLDDPLETYDLAYSVNHYISQSGAPEKIILGLPAYGYDWPCTGPNRGASTTGTADAVFYYEAIELSRTYGRLWDTNSPSPWYRYGSWHQCWYSDSMSLDIRYAYAKLRALMGVGWWALGYDDGDEAFWGAVENQFAITGIDTVDTIIVDNGDPEYITSGSWINGTYVEYGWAGDYQYTSALDDAIAWARWRPFFPRAGEYDVYMWWLAGSNRCDNVPICISGVRNDTLRVSQKGTGATWHYLGRFRFESGNSGYVEIGDWGTMNGSVVIADAVMWIYNGGLFIAQDMESARTIGLKIAPNPFNTACEISIESKELAKSIKIFDIGGRVVQSVNIFGSTFVWCPGKIDPGIYFVNVSSGKWYETEKIVFMP